MVAERAAFTYDGSFEGFLSVIFNIYERRLKVTDIYVSGTQPLALFSDIIAVETNKNQAGRVFKGLIAKAGKKIATSIYRCFLSEQQGIEFKLYLVIKEILMGNQKHFFDYRNENVNDLHKVLKMMRREVHRMHAFVRFQELQDGSYAAVIEPDFNVLPLIGEHFESRYPTMEWVIYDTKRQYGIHYCEYKLKFIDYVNTFTKVEAGVLSSDELAYQEMWKQYFKSVNIPERNNDKLHLRHVPKRYWKNLIEKQ